MNIKIQKGEITLTEQTLKELLFAIHDAKEITEFTNEPMPNCDMEEETYIYELRRRRKKIISGKKT